MDSSYTNHTMDGNENDISLTSPSSSYTRHSKGTPLGSQLNRQTRLKNDQNGKAAVDMGGSSYSNAQYSNQSAQMGYTENTHDMLVQYNNSITQQQTVHMEQIEQKTNSMRKDLQDYIDEALSMESQLSSHRDEGNNQQVQMQLNQLTGSYEAKLLDQYEDLQKMSTKSVTLEKQFQSVVDKLLHNNNANASPSNTSNTTGNTDMTHLQEEILNIAKATRSQFQSLKEYIDQRISKQAQNQVEQHSVLSTVLDNQTKLSQETNDMQEKVSSKLKAEMEQSLHDSTLDLHVLTGNLSGEVDVLRKHVELLSNQVRRVDAREDGVSYTDLKHVESQIHEGLLQVRTKTRVLEKKQDILDSQKFVNNSTNINNNAGGISMDTVKVQMQLKELTSKVEETALLYTQLRNKREEDVDTQKHYNIILQELKKTVLAMSSLSLEDVHAAVDTRLRGVTKEIESNQDKWKRQTGMVQQTEVTATNVDRKVDDILGEVNEQFKQHHERLHGLKKSIQEIVNVEKQDVESIQRQLNSVLARMDSIQDNNDRQDLEVIKTSVSMLDKRGDTLQSEVKMLKNLCETVQKQQVEQQQVQQHNDEDISNTHKLEEQLTPLVQDISTMTTRIDSVNARVSEMKSQIRDVVMLQEELVGVQQQQEALTKAPDGKEGNQASLSELSDILNQIDMQLQNYDNIDQRVVILDNKVEELEGLVHSISGSVASFDSRILENEEQFGHHMQQVAEKFHTMEVQIDTFHNSISTLALKLEGKLYNGNNTSDTNDNNNNTNPSTYDNTETHVNLLLDDQQLPLKEDVRVQKHDLHKLQEVVNTNVDRLNHHVEMLEHDQVQHNNSIQVKVDDLYKLQDEAKNAGNVQMTQLHTLHTNHEELTRQITELHKSLENTKNNASNKEYEHLEHHINELYRLLEDGKNANNENNTHDHTNHNAIPPIVEEQIKEVCQIIEHQQTQVCALENEVILAREDHDALVETMQVTEEKMEKKIHDIVKQRIDECMESMHLKYVYSIKEQEDSFKEQNALLIEQHKNDVEVLLNEITVLQNRVAYLESGPNSDDIPDQIVVEDDGYATVDDDEQENDSGIMYEDEGSTADMFASGPMDYITDTPDMSQRTDDEEEYATDRYQHTLPNQKESSSHSGFVEASSSSEGAHIHFANSQDPADTVQEEQEQGEEELRARDQPEAQAIGDNVESYTDDRSHVSTLPEQEDSEEFEYEEPSSVSRSFLRATDKEERQAVWEQRLVDLTDDSVDLTNLTIQQLRALVQPRKNEQQIPKLVGLNTLAIDNAIKLEETSVRDHVLNAELMFQAAFVHQQDEDLIQAAKKIQAARNLAKRPPPQRRTSIQHSSIPLTTTLSGHFMRNNSSTYNNRVHSQHTSGGSSYNNLNPHQDEQNNKNSVQAIASEPMVHDTTLDGGVQIHDISTGHNSAKHTVHIDDSLHMSHTMDSLPMDSLVITQVFSNPEPESPRTDSSIEMTLDSTSPPDKHRNSPPVKPNDMHHPTNFTDASIVSLDQSLGSDMVEPQGNPKPLQPSQLQQQQQKQQQQQQNNTNNSYTESLSLFDDTDDISLQLTFE